MVALVDAERADMFRAGVQDAYQRAMQVVPEVYVVEAANGAAVFNREEISR
jgi:galactokinase